VFDGASNYMESANGDCAGTVDGDDSSCCEYNTTVVEDADGNPLTVTYGCMNSAACNWIESADADCNVENEAIAGADWEANDDCCNMSGNSVCYLDLNNNGYYEQVDNTTYASESTCDCGELGVGWVAEDAVAEDMEVQGCTQATNAAGDICPEYDPSANVDNGGCCLEEIDWSQFDGFDENSAQFMGVFDVSFTYGMLNSAGDCPIPIIESARQSPALFNIPYVKLTSNTPMN
jgi:hypothetical protein